MKVKEVRGPVGGVVTAWHPDEGWGVLRSPELSGSAFCHFSAIDEARYVILEVGEEVSFTWSEVAQDDCKYSAVHVIRGPAGNDMNRSANLRSLSVILVTLGSHELEPPDPVAADPFRGFLDGVHVFHSK